MLLRIHRAPFFIAMFCACSGMQYARDLATELKNDSQHLALLTIAQAKVRIHSFDGTDVSFCLPDRDLTPYGTQDGETIVWRTNQSFRVEAVGSTIIQKHDTDAFLRWLITVPHHPEALAYAVKPANPLTDKVVFDTTAETAKLLGWPSSHFEREIDHSWSVPSWSPDGKQIALTLADKGPGGMNNIVVWNILSGEQKKIAPGIDASWSPDGRGIFYLRFRGLGNPLAGDAWFDNLSTGQEKQLFHLEDLDTLLRLSPDGKYLLYGRVIYETGNTQDKIWIYRLSDGASMELFRAPRETIVTRGPDWISNWDQLIRIPGPFLASCTE